MRIRFSRTALRQINEALAYLADRSPRAASGLSQRILAVTRLVQDHPDAAQATSRVRIRRLFLTPYPYALFYRVGIDEIVVMRFRHVARLPIY